MSYYLERLKPIKECEWRNESDIYQWVRATDLEFDSITDARNHVVAHCDQRMSYRVTDGGRIWTI